MEIFAEKSWFEIAPFASATLAPIDVPLFKICFERTKSFFS